MEPLYRMQVERKKSNNNNRLLLSRRVFVQVPWIEVFACSCPFSAVCYRCYFLFSLHFALNKRPVIPMAPASIPLHRKSLLPNQGQTNWKIITKLKFFPIENLWNGFKIATGSGRWFLFFIIISLNFLPLLIQIIKNQNCRQLHLHDCETMYFSRHKYAIIRFIPLQEPQNDWRIFNFNHFWVHQLIDHCWFFCCVYGVRRSSRKE